MPVECIAGLDAVDKRFYQEDFYASTTSSAEQDLPPGCIVRIQGLVSSRWLNGFEGEVLGVDEKTGRMKVLPFEVDEIKLIRRRNLEFVEK